MTRSNPSELLTEDPKIERITLRNLEAKIRKKAEELGVELKDVQSENMVEP